jgi:hypothetical protein
MKKITFPIKVGQTVHALVEDENHVTELVPYTVAGLAYFKDKLYVFDDDGEMYEIGTRYCIIPEGTCE